MAKLKQEHCTIYIVRHGQTNWNLRQLTQGESNIPLNSTGEKQARSLRKKLKQIKFDAIFSSDLIRAQKTAEIIAMERKLAVKTTRILRERRFGRYDGKPWKEMNEFYKTWEKLSKQERVHYRPYEEYETDAEAVSRFITFLREIAVTFAGKIVLVVSHGSMMRTLLNHLSDKTYLTGSISNLAYIKLASDGVDFFISELNGIQEPNE